MKAQAVRESFVKFFEEYQHQKIESSSLIPHNDPTLMFANAGMNQFKDYFTGKAKPTNLRAVTIQKCVRAGGKHNDLENVGFTPRHHTFFEMLGNFSFGDYFKKEAIDFAWKFLTQKLGIPKEKLLVTVHYTDDEALNLWHKDQGVPLDRIFKLGNKDNFWEMGDVGPCGPCTEIFYDHGEKFSDGKKHELLIQDEGRFIEIWNLVFMQFEKTADGQTLKLPKPSVDTGAGLERVTAAMQGVYWNYDTDLFQPIIKKIEELSKKSYQDKKYQGSMRVIADHVRAATMLMTDGAIPSNEGRGYVLRRIIRRAVRHINELGIQTPTLHLLVPSVFEILGKEYPQNMANQALAISLLEQEEKKFRETLTQGLKILGEALSQMKPGQTFSGEVAFKLYDTFGFPLDLTETILQDKNITLDHAGFEKSMEKQKADSRKSGKFQAKEDDLKKFYPIKEKNGDTKFLGYEKLSATGKLIAIEKLGDSFGLVFDETPFYGESGGQTGDIGLINKKITVLDTLKAVDGIHVHVVSEIGDLKVGSSYELTVDQANRNLTARNHSATHLLQAALIKVLGQHVKQAGSLVNSEKLRFDFAHTKALTPDEIKKVEDLVNAEIQGASQVQSMVMAKEEATKIGAMALFGEKYGDKVRVIKMGGFSTEFCGGTHVAHTSDIGLLKIVLETSLAAGVRRIEALTSNGAINYLNQRSEILGSLEKKFSTTTEGVISKIDSMTSEMKQKEKEIEILRDKLQAIASEDLFKRSEKVKNTNFYFFENEVEPNDFKKIADLFGSKVSSGVLFLLSITGDKCSFLIKTTPEIKVNLSDFMKKNIAMINGRGGGKPDLVQGSGDSQKIKELISEFKNFIS